MVSQVLRQSRSAFLDGRFRLGEICLFEEMVKSFSVDIDECISAMDELDDSAPGGFFAMWADGCEVIDLPNGEMDFVYRFNRPPSEIAAVFGKAIQRALLREGDE